MGGPEAEPHGAHDVRWPGAGEPYVEVVRPRLSAGEAVPFLVPWLFFIALAVFCSLVPGMLVGQAIAGDGPLVGMIMLTFPPAVAVLSVWLILRIRGRVYRASTVLLSPVGVEVRDHRGSQIRLRWADATGVGRVEGMRAPTLLGRVGQTVAREAVALGRPLHPSDGLIGWGTRELSPRMPERERQIMGRQRRDHTTGRYEIAVPFSIAGPVTPQNRLVAYTWHYRPELLGPPVAERGRRDA